MGPATRKKLNGIVMSRFPNIAREYEKRIRSGIHKIQSRQIAPQDLEKYLRQLDGSINYVCLIAPRKGERFRRELAEMKGERWVARRKMRTKLWVASLVVGGWALGLPTPSEYQFRN